jgi:hypothetical protein
MAIGAPAIQLPARAVARYAAVMIPVWLRRLLFWAAAIFAFVMAVLPHPPHLPVEPNDKVQHMAAFATLGMLGAWSYAATSLVQLLIRLSLFGAAIELFQAIPALHRDSDVKDWIADSLACGLVLLIVWWRRGRNVLPGSAA